MEVDADRIAHFSLKELEADLLISLGEPSMATDAYLQAADITTKTEERCRAWVGAAHGLRDSGEYETGLRILDRAEKASEEDHLLEELSEIHHFKGNIHFVQVNKERCLSEQQKAYDFAKQAGNEMLEAQALIGLFRASTLRGRMREGAQHINRCMSLC